jgi:hypothetical protein
MDLTARAISSQSSDLPHRAAERRGISPTRPDPHLPRVNPEGRSSMRNPYDACDSGPSQAVYSGRP